MRLQSLFIIPLISLVIISCGYDDKKSLESNDVYFTQKASYSSQIIGNYFYLSNWVVTNKGDKIEPFYVWEPRYNDLAVSWFDLRTKTQQSILPENGLVQCCALLYLNQQISGENLQLISNGVDSLLQVNKNTLELLLNIPIGSLDGDFFNEILFDLIVNEFNLRTDRKPLKPNKNLVYSFKMGGVRIFNSNLDFNSIEWQNLKEIISNDYIERREYDISSGSETYLKYLATQSFKYRVNYTEFLGTAPDEGTRKPETVINESFDCSNSIDPDCDLDWIEIFNGGDIDGNRLELQDNNNWNRLKANSVLSTDDHYALADVETITSGTSRFNVGVGVRVDDINDEGYFCVLSARNDEITIYEVNSGSPSSIASQAQTIDHDVIYNIRLEIDGSDLECDVDSGTWILTVSDSTLTGDLYVGVGGQVSDGNRFYIDDFEGGDLGAVVRRRLVN